MFDQPKFQEKLYNLVEDVQQKPQGPEKEAPKFVDNKNVADNNEVKETD